MRRHRTPKGHGPRIILPAMASVSLSIAGGTHRPSPSPSTSVSKQEEPTITDVEQVSTHSDEASAAAEWEQYVDESTGIPYYFDHSSGESTWEAPAAWKLLQNAVTAISRPSSREPSSYQQPHQQLHQQQQQQQFRVAKLAEERVVPTTSASRGSDDFYLFDGGSDVDDAATRLPSIGGGPTRGGSASGSATKLTEKDGGASSGPSPLSRFRAVAKKVRGEERMARVDDTTAHADRLANVAR